MINKKQAILFLGDVMKNKVVIIGCGNVGMSYAYAILNQRTTVTDLVLIDKLEDKAMGEASDLNHGLAFGPSKLVIKKGTYSDVVDAKIVCIAAGFNQTTNETRMDLIEKNKKIFEEIVNKCMENGFNGIFLIATNPVDIMTYITYKISKLPNRKIIGTGTTLDTARLRFLISKKLKINTKNIHAYVMGEHGDSEFISWSTASVGLLKLDNLLNEKEQNKICENVKNAAYDIIKKKGNTSFGIGMSLVRITNAILSDENSILSVSSYDKDNKCFFGGPTIINKDGAVKKLYINLSKEEEKKLKNSINIITSAIKKIDPNFKVGDKK